MVDGDVQASPVFEQAFHPRLGAHTHSSLPSVRAFSLVRKTP
jgi:hypothetical protein